MTKLKIKKKQEPKMLNNKELADIMQQEMSPSAKLLKIGLILAGGVDLNVYTIGHKVGMHPSEIHIGLTELKMRKQIDKGQNKDTVTVRR